MTDYEQQIDRLLTEYRVPFDRNKLLAAYQRGQEAGTQAVESPELVSMAGEALVNSYLGETLDQAKRILGEPVSFRDGYIKGLADFLKDHKIDTRFTSTYSRPESLTLDMVLHGYIQGSRLEDPRIVRDPSPIRTSNRDSLMFLNPVMKTDWQIALERLYAQRRDGYRLGFTVGVARDFDITLSPIEVPADTPTYEVFMQGLRAEPRPLPVEQPTPRYELKESIDKYERPVSGIWIFDVLNDNAYRAGQRVWLASQGLDASYALLIRDPQALDAFKAGLEGETLTGFLPKLSAFDIDPLISRSREPEFNQPRQSGFRFPQERFLRNKEYFQEENFKPNRSDYESSFEGSRRSDTLSQAAAQRRFAYQLGLTASLHRKDPKGPQPKTT